METLRASLSNEDLGKECADLKKAKASCDATVSELTKDVQVMVVLCVCVCVCVWVWVGVGGCGCGHGWVWAWVGVGVSNVLCSFVHIHVVIGEACLYIEGGAVHCQW